MRKKERVHWILSELSVAYPDAHCELNYRNPFELLVATILSAQCTDIRVNQVTSALFERYPDPQAFAEASLFEIEEAVRPTGFFRNKAAAIQGTARQLLTLYGGEVPNQMDDLIKLPGVGRKTASVVMGNAYGKAEGVVVDTHVSRLSQRLGLTDATLPEKIEKDLIRLIPKKLWVIFPHWMIAHGRSICKARKPLCAHCPLAVSCPSAKNCAHG
ncbi:MAG: endonuclease III [Candidatus Sericytochromatia bacterium]